MQRCSYARGRGEQGHSAEPQFGDGLGVGDVGTLPSEPWGDQRLCRQFQLTLHKHSKLEPVLVHGL